MKILLKSILKEIAEIDHTGKYYGTTRPLYKETIDRTFQDWNTALKSLSRYAPDNPADWTYEDADGYIVYTALENDDGDEATDAQVTDFESGAIRLWDSRVEVKFSLVEERVATTQELTNWGFNHK
jgi:hypothetical protein